MRTMRLPNSELRQNAFGIAGPLWTVSRTCCILVYVFVQLSPHGVGCTCDVVRMTFPQETRSGLWGN